MIKVIFLRLGSYACGTLIRLAVIAVASAAKATAGKPPNEKVFASVTTVTTKSKPATWSIAVVV